ncbi:MAG: FAD:protein FMN transferase [Microbacterium sp.]|uniref:FAD:protein FMN transferase n=1 Tax=Microbacterium sp. TaxID=51671 RepID=UPI003F9EA777
MLAAISLCADARCASLWSIPSTRSSRSAWPPSLISRCAHRRSINRRAWGEGLHHVLDARTGAPVRTWAATWAIAPSAMHADAVATALFFEGGADLARQWGVEWVRMSTDGYADRSEGRGVELFTTRRLRG